MGIELIVRRPGSQLILTAAGRSLAQAAGELFDATARFQDIAQGISNRYFAELHALTVTSAPTAPTPPPRSSPPTPVAAGDHAAAVAAAAHPGTGQAGRQARKDPRLEGPRLRPPDHPAHRDPVRDPERTPRLARQVGGPPGRAGARLRGGLRARRAGRRVLPAHRTPRPGSLGAQRQRDAPHRRCLRALRGLPEPLGEGAGERARERLLRRRSTPDEGGRGPGARLECCPGPPRRETHPAVRGRQRDGGRGPNGTPNSARHYACWSAPSPTATSPRAGSCAPAPTTGSTRTGSSGRP